MDAPVLIVPGLGDSGPDHWQTLWEKTLSGCARVTQRDWDHPDRGEWVANLDAAVADCSRAPVLVGHSLGCLTAAHWAVLHRRPIRGALLVAPTDADRHDASLASRSFRPIPMSPLPFPSILVASSDDPYISLERAREFAQAWGSRFVDIGAAGHVNAAAGFGPWPAGKELLQELR
jgi:serine hydrolase